MDTLDVLNLSCCGVVCCVAREVLKMRGTHFQSKGHAVERELMGQGEPASNGADFADIRILIIDDDSINAMLAKSVLERMGCTVQISPNPVKALEKYARDKDTIDLVLVDYFMPTMDGGATVDHLR